MSNRGNLELWNAVGTKSVQNCLLWHDAEVFKALPPTLPPCQSVHIYLLWHDAEVFKFSSHAPSLQSQTLDSLQISVAHLSSPHRCSYCSNKNFCINLCSVTTPCHPEHAWKIHNLSATCYWCWEAVQDKQGRAVLGKSYLVPSKLTCTHFARWQSASASG